MKVEEIVSSPLLESVSLPDLINKLGQEAIISYITTPKLSGGKKNEQVGRITKLTENLLVTLIGNGGEYEKRMQQSNPDFVAGPLPWGYRRPDGLIEHNGELYVQFIVEGPGQVRYFLDDTLIDKSEIIGLPVNVKREVPIQFVKVANLIAIH